eukprot:gb/GECG01014338.1/.p1 GENE.gb/GECG01014338.1/~~gb/GECG01014338.1/.p1  ORF type:complete len:104 (+),score=3.83 gb/GECG01014338.1/:1-312(+)
MLMAILREMYAYSQEMMVCAASMNRRLYEANLEVTSDVILGVKHSLVLVARVSSGGDLSHRAAFSSSSGKSLHYFREIPANIESCCHVESKQCSIPRLLVNVE